MGPGVVAAVNSEGWRQLGELGVAFVLSSLVGIEREVRQKSAGLRTHSLVGVGAALFMLISKYGFADVVSRGTIVADPSRVGAQIVSGIGFLGAGIIFVRRDVVRGLTTAAAIWLTAAIGAAAGAGLPLLAAAATAAYFAIVVGFPLLARRLPRSLSADSVISVRYRDGQGILRHILARTTGQGFAVADLAVHAGAGGSLGATSLGSAAGDHSGLVEVRLSVHGRGSVSDLAATLTELEGVDTVRAGDANEQSE